MTLPYKPGDWVRHKLFLHVARVVECCAAAEKPDGVDMVVRYMDDHRCGADPRDWEPCAPPRPALRLVHSDLRRPISPAQTLVGSSGNPPASLAIRPVPECELTQIKHIADTIKRHTESGSDYHD